jgi:hypothetical protein
MDFIMNDIELTAQMHLDFVMIVDAVSDRVLNEIVKPSISEHVYRTYLDGTPRKYDRLGENGGFLGSWQSTVSGEEGNSIKATIESNPEKMVFEPDGAHHSGADFMTDVRSYMSEVILNGTDWAFEPQHGQNGWWQESWYNGEGRDFWTPIVEALHNGSIDKIIEVEMSKMGFNFRKTGDTSSILSEEDF